MNIKDFFEKYLLLCQNKTTTDEIRIVLTFANEYGSFDFKNKEEVKKISKKAKNILVQRGKKKIKPMSNSLFFSFLNDVKNCQRHKKNYYRYKNISTGDYLAILSLLINRFEKKKLEEFGWDLKHLIENEEDQNLKNDFKMIFKITGDLYRDLYMSKNYDKK